MNEDIYNIVHDYDLIDEDYDNITNLVKTSKSLNTILTEMESLELQGLKDSARFRKLQSYLPIVLEVESKEYVKSNLSVAKCNKYQSVLLEDFFKDNESSYVYSILNLDTISASERRVYNNLNSIANIMFSNLLIRKNIEEDKINELLIKNNAAENLNMELLLTFLSELDRLSKEINTDKARNTVIKVKYYLAKTSDFILTNLLKVNFNVPKVVRHDDLDTNGPIYLSYFNRLAITILGYFLTLDSDNNEDYSNMLIWKSLFNVTFSYLQTEDILFLFKIFSDKVTEKGLNKEFLSKYLGMQILENNLKELIENREKSRHK